MGPEEQQLVTTEAEALLFAVVPLMVVIIGYGTFLAVDGYTFMQTSEQGLIGQAQAADKKTMIWHYMSDWPGTITLLLSDGIVVWRACSLFQQDRFWRLILVMLMIANIVPPVSIQGSYSGLAFECASLVVNMVATILFCLQSSVGHILNVQIWKDHRYIAGFSGDLARRVTRAENILNLLMESGAIFCAIQCISIIITVLDAYNVITSSWPPEIVQAIAAVAFACYPVSVIILIHKGNEARPATYSSERPSQNEYIFSTIIDSNGIVMRA
ncbi:hypothetical protein BDP27DRAFT_1367025 [Rhodocollybia butyracea]|uniref:Uncharacterized protein n=1 Tax=Rhodocollybia butyracea TaxID=206335 RepID=A0A9P5PJW1_9AGAR|nr:hypothetical protein BDP27DRAFT_1367025 [Rhodocollybia butyracea]